MNVLYKMLFKDWIELYGTDVLKKLFKRNRKKDFNFEIDYDFKLTYLDMSNWDVEYIHNFYSCFENYTKLEVLNLSNWKLNKFANLKHIFRNCNSLHTIYCSEDVFNRLYKHLPEYDTWMWWNDNMATRLTFL